MSNFGTSMKGATLITEHAPNRSKKLVLIASNDPNIRNSLADVLPSTTYEVLIAKRGTDVLLKILDRDIDILLLDIDMNGIIGVEILPVIRRLRPRLPIVLISDDFTSQVRKIAAEQGMTYQTFKPHTGSEVRAIIKATEKIIERRELIRIAMN